MEYLQNLPRKKVVAISFGAVLIIFLFNFLLLSAPGGFAVGEIVTVEEGMSLRAVSKELKDKNFIRSRVIFEAFVIAYAGERHVISSPYYFEKKLPVYEVARRISKGKSQIAPLKVTIPEGFNNEEIGEAFVARLPNFNREKFLLDAKNKQGYLFPDTYFFFFLATEADALKSMSSNFETKVSTLREEIAASGKSEKNIIIMASIIEEEAKGNKGGGDDRGTISGILWKRLSIGRALEVDAAPETYKTRGLPAAPITNPGLESIKAAIHPTSSPFLYYLHDKEGNIHYARSFEEHKQNIQTYLK